ARTVKVGGPRLPDVQRGPVSKKARFERVNRYIQLGIDQGATLLAGGVSNPGKGWFVRPTIFANARNDMAIARDEIFGPVGTVITFGSEEEAVTL
ncbi:aldehyde dehydrogenase family protein, partial [Pseudomonas brassicacearum]|uniref:aldehyde dehydrogenase family protein n=1 Tax=Pseudomonas brassicacearum TaxID=930166 RepID=UPI000F4662C9